MKLIFIALLAITSSCALPQLSKIEADAEIDGKEVQFDFGVSDKH